MINVLNKQEAIRVYLDEKNLPPDTKLLVKRHFELFSLTSTITKELIDLTGTNKSLVALFQFSYSFVKLDHTDLKGVNHTGKFLSYGINPFSGTKFTALPNQTMNGFVEGYIIEEL